MPVDVDPRSDGNCVWRKSPGGVWYMHVLKKGEPPATARRFMAHWATCADPDHFRAKKTPPAPTPAPAPAGPPPAPAPPAPAGPGVLLAVDGNSLAHRAYHAYEKSAMATPDGQPVWAVYGFLALLAGIIERTEPAAVVVGFDDRASSTRRDRYADYKAGRAERSEDLYAQLGEIPDVLTALGVTVVTPAGLEADDVLASAAAAAERAGWRCVVATSDKDAFGLITDRTTVMRLVNGLDNAVSMTPAALLDKYGVTPAQWPDYVALIGDTSDNLPGVPGVGPKTAVKLLAACGTLSAALDDPAAVASAVGKAAAAKLGVDAARTAIDRNRDIMAPVRDIPVDPAGCRPAAVASTVAAVLRGRHLPALVDRVTAALCRPVVVPPAGPDPRRVRAEMVRRGREQLVADRAVPAPAAAVVTVDDAPRLAQVGADQPAADRTCGRCATVCPAVMPALGGGAPVLLDAEWGLYDQLAVHVDGRWHVRPVADGEHGTPYWNRRQTHHCPVRPLVCQTPGHAEPRPGRLFPGGVFCASCEGPAPGQQAN
jgi:DNA polymerase-1